MFKLINNCFNCFKSSEQNFIKNEFKNKNEINKEEDVFDQNADELIRNYADKLIIKINAAIDLKNKEKIQNNHVIYYVKFQNSDELVKYIKNLFKDPRTTDLNAEIVNFIQTSVRCKYRTEDLKKKINKFE